MAHILLIDDIPELVETEKQLISEIGSDYHVFVASTSENAFNLLETHSFNLVVLDLMMPNKNGFEMLREIKQKYNIPVMIYSAYIEYQSPQTLLNQGADMILTKPAPLHNFVTAIKSLVEQHKSPERTVITVEGYNLREIKRHVMTTVLGKALERTNKDVSRAAELMGIRPKSLYRYIKRLEKRK